MTTNVLAIAATSMADDTMRMATISHNIANATTPGFKKDITVSRPFLEYLQAYGIGMPPQTFLTSLPVPDTVVDFKAGSLRYTGGSLDVALDGDGFFELQGAEAPLYTRQGNFQIDSRGRLVNASGIPLAGDITVTSNQVRIDQQGRVFDVERPAGQLRVVAFEHTDVLQKAGAGVFVAPNTGAGMPIDTRVRQGYLENSNVVTVNEMVAVIETMRHFEASQKLIQGYDEMLDRAIRTLGDYNY
jgi:flagellar basal body rod protein FlgG